MNRIAFCLLSLIVAVSVASCSKGSGGGEPAPQIRALTTEEKTQLLSVLEGAMASQLGVPHIGRGGTAVLGKPRARQMVDIIKGSCNFPIKASEGNTKIMEMTAENDICPVNFKATFTFFAAEGKKQLYGPVKTWSFALKENKDNGLGANHRVEFTAEHGTPEVAQDRGTILGLSMRSSAVIKTDVREFSSGTIDIKSKTTIYKDEMVRREAAIFASLPGGASALIEMTETTGGPDGYEIKMVLNKEVLPNLQAIQLRARIPNLVMEINPQQ